MSLICNKDKIERLITILNYKRVTCQKKLSELDKINNLKSTLLKHSNNPTKGLIELNDKELIQLFDEFVNVEYTVEELEVMKYWINEGWTNNLIENSSQFKEARKMFNTLIDRIQVYLDFTRSFYLNKDEIINELNLVDSLRDKLVNDTIVVDLEPYYSLFTGNETMSENDIYYYLTSICIKNIDLFSGDSINGSLKEVNENIKQSIITYLQSLIDRKKNDELKDNYISEKIKKLSIMIEKLEKNYEFLYDIYPSTIEEVMSDVWDNDDITYYKDRLAIPITLIKGKNKGLDMKLSKDDSNIIEEFLDDLKDKLEKLKVKETQYNEGIMSNNDYIKNIDIIIKKLSDNSDILTEEDINRIVDCYLSNNEKKPLLDVINEINNINVNKYFQNKDKIVNEKEQKEEVVDKRDLKKYEILFNKYNYNFNAFPSRIINELIINSSYEHVKEMIEYINSIEKFSFIKDFTNSLTNSVIDSEIKEIKCSQICFILAYSDINIISNLVKISDTDNINLYDIFSIPKVFSSNKNKKMPGAYENFVANERLIKEEYPNLLNEFMTNYPFILGTDYELFKKNINLTELYGLHIDKDTNYSFPSPLALSSQDFEYIIDRYIELHEYDLVEKYRNLIGTSNLNDLIIRYKDIKNIDIEKNKYYHFKKEFSTDINKGLVGLSVENIPVAYSDSTIKKIDKLNEETDENKKNYYYIFNGVCVSKIKTLKYFSTLLINKYKDKKEALLYSMTKDSFLTEKEFDSLKDFVYGGK